jgi:hypothetical protein
LHYWQKLFSKHSAKLLKCKAKLCNAIVVGIGIAYGLDVLTDVKSDFTPNSVEANATQDSIDAVAKFPEKMGILATVIIAAIVIGVLVKAFMTQSR